MNPFTDSLVPATGVCGVAMVAAAAIVALSLARLARALRRIADDAARGEAMWIRVTDVNWREVVSQLAADALGEPALVNSFAGMTASRERGGSMRFVLRDARVLAFSVGVERGAGLELGARAAGELDAVWAYFARHTGEVAPVPRHHAWRAMLLPAPATAPVPSRNAPRGGAR